MNPIEFPVLAALGLGVVIYSFSRVMLAVDKSTGASLFIIFGLVVLIAGILFAVKPNMKRSLVIAICVLGAVGIFVAGIISASPDCAKTSSSRKVNHMSIRNVAQNAQSTLTNLPKATCHCAVQ